MPETESLDRKLCPECNTINALQNIHCIKCGSNLLNISAEPFWKKDMENVKSLESISDVFYEILVTASFLITLVAGVYGSRFFWLISLILIIYMVKNNYLDFLVEVLRKNWRR